MSAPRVPFPRVLDVDVPPGQDCVAVKRAMSRAGYWPWATFSDDYTVAFSKAMKVFQTTERLQPDGVYGFVTHERLRLTPWESGPKGTWAFDAEAIRMMRAQMLILHPPVDQALVTAERMLAYARQFDGPYVYGGEHDATLADDTPHDNFDCSSSTSKLLYHFNMLGSTHAQVSGWFETWGARGRGKYVTVHSNGDHVWTEFNVPEGYFRFDTSPHGDGERGPRVRSGRRGDSYFHHRHPPRM